MTLIRLRVCAGWLELLLVAHTTLLEISCRGSIICILYMLPMIAYNHGPKYIVATETFILHVLLHI